MLQEYVADRDGVAGQNEDALFVSSRGCRISSSQVYRLVREQLSQVATVKRKGPHTLRHTFATAMLNNDAELSAVKELLGHEQLATTEVYTHVTFEELKKVYPVPVCALESGGDPWKLLVMGRLSAQCTDARVNIVCRELFSVYPDCNAMAEADLPTLEKLVYSCGVYKVKAANIRDFSVMIRDRFDGRVPDTMDELLTLPGVGRKIANLILGDIYKKPAIVADTHCIRISNRLGLCDSKTPEKVEKTLVSLVPPEEQSDFCHRLVMFGREVCDAKKPKCEECPFKNFDCVI